MSTIMGTPMEVYLSHQPFKWFYSFVVMVLMGIKCPETVSLDCQCVFL